MRTDSDLGVPDPTSRVTESRVTRQKDTSLCDPDRLPRRYHAAMLHRFAPMALVLIQPACIAFVTTPARATFPRLVVPARITAEMHFSEAALCAKDDTDEQSLVAADPTLDKERRAWRRNIVQQILLFAGPAVSTTLADPLMSVVDAVCCGRFCSTIQLASLGPSLAVFNFVN